MYNIAIVGVGQIGSRHLQGLVKSSKQFRIFLVDPSEKALAVAKQRFKEVSSSGNSSISYYQNIKDLPKKIDIGIIASTSNVRRKIVESFLEKRSVDFLILEKVVFQRSEDFEPVQKLFIDKKVKAWVNCPSRSYPFYNNLKKELVDEKISIKIKGNNWGLACNGFHIIDLFVFLTEQNDFVFNTDGLENIIFDSKRNGFNEFKGKLKIRTRRGDTLELIDSVKYDDSHVISISNDSIQYNIFEREGLIVKHISENEIQEDNLKIQLQSELTGSIVDQIIDTGKSDLTTYDECMKYHIPMLDAFNAHISKVTGQTLKICPIT